MQQGNHASMRYGHKESPLRRQIGKIGTINRNQDLLKNSQPSFRYNLVKRKTHKYWRILNRKRIFYIYLSIKQNFRIRVIKHGFLNATPNQVGGIRYKRIEPRYAISTEPDVIIGNLSYHNVLE
jgi:hypothetical protein